MKKYVKPLCEKIGVIDVNICSTSHPIDIPEIEGSNCNCDITSPWHDQGCIGCECGCRDY